MAPTLQRKLYVPPSCHSAIEPSSDASHTPYINQLVLNGKRKHRAGDESK